MTTHAIETELLKVTGVKPQRKKEDEQKYLMRLLNAISHKSITDEVFFGMSDETQQWVDEGVAAVANSQDIPYFNAVVGEDEDEEDEDEDEEEVEEEDEDEDEEEVEEEDEDEDEDEEEVEEEDEDEDEEDEDEDNEADEDEDEPEEEEEYEEMTVKKAKSKKSKSEKKDSTKAKVKKIKTKVVKAKVKKSDKSTGSKRGRPSSFTGKKIKILERKPKIREGTLRAERWDLAVKSKTVDAYIAAGGKSGFLKVAIDQGWIELV